MHNNAKYLDPVDWGITPKVKRQSDWIAVMFVGMVIGSAVTLVVLHEVIIAPLLAATI